MKRNNEGKKLKEVKLTLQEWFDALRVPTPIRNKKKYRRKKKHKGKEELSIGLKENIDKLKES